MCINPHFIPVYKPNTCSYHVKTLLCLLWLFIPSLLPSLSAGAFTFILAASSHSQSDESRDHPEAAGTQLWPNWEHKQLPQPLCAAAHQCQVRFLLLYLGLSLLSSLRLIAPDTILSSPSTLLLPCLLLSSLLSTYSTFWISPIRKILPSPLSPLISSHLLSRHLLFTPAPCCFSLARLNSS